MKTALDFVGAALLALLFSPLLLCVAIAIKVSDRGPAFYRQERVGLAGKSRVWKFRSMTHGADEKIDQAKAGANQQNAVFYKSAADSRITRSAGCCAERASMSYRSCSTYCRAR